jgi:hypothetical protein
MLGASLGGSAVVVNHQGGALAKEDGAWPFAAPGGGSIGAGGLPQFIHRPGSLDQDAMTPGATPGGSVVASLTPAVVRAAPSAAPAWPAGS